MNMTQAGRVAVVTGASAGIGKATARMLAELGWHVIGIGRDPGRSATAEAELRAAASPEGRVDFLRADFDDMADVRRVAREIAGLTDRVHVLVNNAGGVRDKLYVTKDGFESTLAANHLAAFLLTRELMPLLKAAAGSSPPGTTRVLAVSSLGHLMCKGMNWDDLNMFDQFTTGGAYCQAKLANLLFTRELARRFEKDGIVAQSMHPGRVDSNFASHGDQAMKDYMASADTVSVDEPARTLVWMATAPECGAPGGRYFYDLEEIEPGPQALDGTAARQLWEESERLLAAVPA
jgi:NAD(P)-dependent dehydrogenase (short-subunit alcohol dehydrogenase family)